MRVCMRASVRGVRECARARACVCVCARVCVCVWVRVCVWVCVMDQTLEYTDLLGLFCLILDLFVLWIRRWSTRTWTRSRRTPLILMRQFVRLRHSMR